MSSTARQCTTPLNGPLEMVSAGEALITFGAGNVWMAGEEMLERLRHANPDTAAPSSSDVSAPAPKQEGQS